MKVPVLSRKRPKGWFSSTALVALSLGALIAGVLVTAKPTYANTSAPPAGGYFSILPPGSQLPSASKCQSDVRRSTWEPRPENTTANSTVPTTVSIPGFTPNDGFDSRARTYANLVTGNFKGTTDEIIQWASCKWGASDDIVRAMAVTESSWYQGLLDANGKPIDGKGYGDFSTSQAKCQVGYVAPCPQSFGLLEVKATSEPGTFPWSRDSTAFNADYALMTWRVCYEGWTSWLNQYPGGSTPYKGGDAWGCVGFWYSGDWYGADGGAQSYIDTVKKSVNAKPWLTWADRSPSPSGASVVSINDTAKGTGANQFEFVGTWWPWDEAGAYHGDTRGSWDGGNYYQVRFNGTKVSVYATVGPGSGPAAVSIDGGPESPVNFFSATQATQKLVFASPVLPAGPHIIRVRNAGSGTLIQADRVDISSSGPVSINDSAKGTGTNQFEFVGTWWPWDEAGAYHGDTRGSWDGGNYYQVRFNGTKVSVYATVGPGSGPAAVSIDGGPESPVNFFSATQATQKLVFASPVLPAGPHIIRVRNAGSGTLIQADRVDIS